MLPGATSLLAAAALLAAPLPVAAAQIAAGGGPVPASSGSPAPDPAPPMPRVPLQAPRPTPKKRGGQQSAALELPMCVRYLGTIAIVEPDTNWWQPVGLGSPEAVIRALAQQSGCFTVVNRGSGLAVVDMKRLLAGGGKLQAGSHVGQAQIKAAADYYIVPGLAARDDKANGAGIGGLLGGITGSGIGGIDTKRKEANVTLTLVNTRTTEQTAVTEGSARKSDLAFGAASGTFWTGGLAAGGGGYRNSDIGQLVATAYLDAFTHMVAELGGLGSTEPAPAPK